MGISTVISCVNYDDFLSLTLSRTLGVLDDVTILTAPDDDATIALAQRHGVRVLATDAWRSGSFNKAKSLNEWLAQLDDAEPEESWCLTLDADILLPAGVTIDVRGLDPATLFGARRRMCDSEAGWHALIAGARAPDSFPLDVASVWQGRVWMLPTANPAGLQGCFHLWNRALGAGDRRFTEAPSAGDYDVAFALSFPEERRAFLAEYDILHLGECRTNWQGRRSSRWAPTPDGQDGSTAPTSVFGR
jgi:hypothetical protein